jgi:hypothetical protein
LERRLVAPWQKPGFSKKPGFSRLLFERLLPPSIALDLSEAGPYFPPP